MNINLIRFLGKLIIFAILSINSFGFTENLINLKNVVVDKNATPSTKLIEYETIVSYSYNIPVNKERIVTKGIDGLIETDYDGNEINVIREMVSEEKIIGLGQTGEYTGRLTGYGPDCIGCSKLGNVACSTREGTNHSLITDGIKYNDQDFGNVRILAADRRLFPCGTIITVSNTKIGTFKGVVLDTGSEMRKYYDQGKILLDLAYSSGKDKAVEITTTNDAKYEVERWGW